MHAKIDRVEVFVTDLPVRLQRMTVSGRYDTGAPGRLLGKPVLVRISAEGVTGYGQIRPISPSHFLPETVHSVVGAIADIYAPRLIGRDITDLEQIHELFDTSLPGNANARAAIDSALHDALGKLWGVPVHALIGGCSQQLLPLEWSVGMSDPVDGMIEESLRAIEEFGIRVICLKAGHPAGWRRDVENFLAVRDRLPDDVVLGVDPNTGWTVPGAVSAVRALQGEGLSYLEQPIDRDDIDGLRLIREACDGVVLMADEAVATPAEALRLIEARAVDVLCIKLYKMGGIHAARKIAALADAANVKVNVGGLAVMSQLEAAAGAHFYASIPARRIMPAAEFVFGLGNIGPDPIVPEPAMVIEDGHVRVPTRPGLGVTVDEEALASHTLRHEVIDTAA